MQYVHMAFKGKGTKLLTVMGKRSQQRFLRRLCFAFCAMTNDNASCQLCIRDDECFAVSVKSERTNYFCTFDVQGGGCPKDDGDFNCK